MSPAIDRKRIILFVAITYVNSIGLAVAIYLTGGIFLKPPFMLTPLAMALMAMLMFAPAIANILTRLITHEGWSNMLLRPKFRRGWPFYLAALFLPPLATIVGGAVYYLLFPGRFDPSMAYARETMGLVPVAGVTGIWTFLATTAPYIMLASLMTLPLPFGEEFGWRAYLLPRLFPLGSRKAVLLVGAIWAVWHWPFVFMGYEYMTGYWGAPVTGPLLWVLICCYFSAFLAWVTLRSGSVWPAAVAHGVINAEAALMVYFIRGAPDYLVGPIPVGIIGSLGYAILAVLIFIIPGALALGTFLQPKETQ